MTSASSDASRRSAVLACEPPLVALALTALLGDAGFEVGPRTAAADLFILDYSADAIGQLRLLRAEAAATRVILLIDDGDGRAASNAVELGVDGLLERSTGIAAAAACIAGVAAGGQWLDPRAMRAAYDVAADRTTQLSLTTRETEIARLVAAGQRNRVIAAGLGISEGTVKMHLHNVYAKLGLESRTQLAMDVRRREPG